jgi:hypothetical protein
MFIPAGHTDDFDPMNELANLSVSFIALFKTINFRKWLNLAHKALMKRIGWEILVLSRRQFTEKTSFDRKRKRLSNFRHLYLVLTALGICMPIPIFAQTRSDESDSKASVVRVPFVGCPSDGQVGPEPAPTAASVVVRLKSVEAKMLTYYEAEVAGGVLAPRGWHGFGSYGTSGSTLTVTPHALKTPDDVFAEEKGPAIVAHYISGEMSGRFSVAQVIARIFPKRIKFTESVIKEVRDRKAIFHPVLIRKIS